MKQGARRDVHYNDFIGLLKNPVGHGFAHPQSGDLQDLVAEAGEILDIHGGKNVDAAVEEGLHVLPAALAFGTRCVGVRKIVDDADSGLRWRMAVTSSSSV